ncbi:MAG: methyltransferase domain-containing protein [Phycisphaerales bacterium]|nr:methyltransferase domain-containing protein [Phycisphaerales bacterium]
MDGSRSRPLGGQTQRFLREFLIRPATVGAIAPSSRGLARRMVEGLSLEQATAVVEYGPGTGAFTEEVLRRLAPGARFFAIERSPDMARDLRRRFPHLKLYEESAADVERLCLAEGIHPGEVDCVISGLPFAAFPTQLQEAIITATLRVLKPGGRFVTFAYYVAHLKKAGREFRRLLERSFDRVELSRGVMFNMPPAFVYRCRKSDAARG